MQGGVENNWQMFSKRSVQERARQINATQGARPFTIHATFQTHNRVPLDCARGLLHPLLGINPHPLLLSINIPRHTLPASFPFCATSHPFPSPPFPSRLPSRP